MATSNFIPSVLTLDPPSKQSSISTYRAMQNARELLELYQGAVEGIASDAFKDRVQTALDDLELMVGAVK